MKVFILGLASQTKNAEWMESRKVGKITQKQETDAIKDFVEYAMRQGSQHAAMYYTNISTMANKALFVLEQKYPKIRDILTIHQLSVISVADRVVSNALQEGMEKSMQYKEIYQLAKERVEQLAKIHGKTLIPAFQITGPTLQLEFDASC